MDGDSGHSASHDGYAVDLGQLAERMGRYSRLVSLVAEQLRAAHEEDRERLARLDKERASVELELAGSAAEDAPDENAVPPCALLQDEFERALSLLAEHLESGRVTDERWTRIEEGAVRSARQVPPPRLVSKRYPRFEARQVKVDVRL